MRQELVPAAPDIVLYYEGANQFSLHGLARDIQTDRASPASSERRRFELARLMGYSALARRLHALRLALVPPSAAEPSKPDYSLDWPGGLDEFKPELDYVDLPLDLPTILSDLESIRRDAQDIGARLVMTSFVWMVWDGMVLDPRRQPSFSSYFGYLNEKMAPYRYSDIRRIADFQNRVFHRYAQAANIPFVDIADQFPRDPRFFNDPIHNTPQGSRLRAWIVFQQLLPIIESRLARGGAAQERLLSSAAHLLPATGSPRRLEFAVIRRSCGVPPSEGVSSSPPSSTPRARVRLEDLVWHRDTSEAHFEARRGGLLVRTDRRPWGRQVSASIDTHGAKEALIRITLRLRSGGVRLSAVEEGQHAERALLFLRRGQQEAALRMPLSGRGRLRVTWANARPNGGQSIFRILDLEIGLR